MRRLRQLVLLAIALTVTHVLLCPPSSAGGALSLTAAFGGTMRSSLSNSRTVLLTGADGAVGSAVARALLDEGFEVHALALRPAELPWGQLVLERGAVTDAYGVAQAVERLQPALVFHLAAAGPSASPQEAMEVHALGTLNVLEAVRAAGLAGSTRVLVGSSSAVYGKGPTAEDQPVAPTTALGASWASAETLARQYAASHGVQPVIARLFAHSADGVLGDLAQQVAEQSPLLRVEAASLDLTDARDSAPAVVKLAQLGEPGEAYNVGSGRAVTAQQLADLAMALSEVPVQKTTVGPPAPPPLVADISKLQQLTGWEPARSLEPLVLDAVRQWRGSPPPTTPPPTTPPPPTTTTTETHPNWVVVTSINEPTPQIKRLAAMPGWRVLVVGDNKSPATYEWENCVFLSMEAQRALGYGIVPLVPENHYGRKNIGYLYAMQHGARVIYDTDDDNVPTFDSVVMVPERYPAASLRPADGQRACNPYAHFGRPDIWPRGYPLELIDEARVSPCTAANANTKLKLVPVQQGLADLDPDVDAIFRLTRGADLKKVRFDPSAAPVALPRESFSPFNSQNTVFHQSGFWALMIPVTTTFRVCDIWRSYWAQRLLWDMGAETLFLPATVEQDRNAHNYLADFADEQDLYLRAGELVEFLRAWRGTGDSIYARAEQLAAAMAAAGFWEQGDAALAAAWVADLRALGVPEPPLVEPEQEPSFDVAVAVTPGKPACMTLTWPAAAAECVFTPVVEPQFGFLPPTARGATSAEVCGLSLAVEEYSVTVSSSCGSSSRLATYKHARALGRPVAEGGRSLAGVRVVDVEARSPQLREALDALQRHTDLDVARDVLVGCAGDAFLPLLRDRPSEWQPGLAEQQQFASLAADSVVDAFLCVSAPAMCELYAGAGRPVVVQTGLQHPVPDAARWLAALHALHANPRAVVATTNELDFHFVRHYLGWSPVRWPAHALYARDEGLWSSPSGGSGPVVALTSGAAELTGVPAWDGESDLASHRMVVVVPDQLHSLQVTELYARGIPIAAPARQLMAEAAVDGGVAPLATPAPFFDAGLRGSALAQHPEFAPDKRRTVDEVFFWLQYADLWRWPHVLHFDSWTAMPDIDDAQLAAVSAQMISHFTEEAEESAYGWRAALVGALGLS